MPHRASAWIAALLIATQSAGCAGEADVAGAGPVGDGRPEAPPRFEVVADDGHRLGLWHRASSAGQPVVLLLHGRTWSALPDFDLVAGAEDLSVMRALKRQGFNVYALDMRGYGSTPRDASGWLTPDRAAADVGATLGWIGERHPGGRDVTLIGWSYGAMVAMLTTQRYPARVGRLVLYGFPRDVEEVIAPSPAVGEPPRRPTTRAAAAEDFIVPGTISDAAVAAYVEAALAADPVRMDWRSLEQWNALEGARVTRPTLLLQAQFDPYMNMEADGRLFRSLATADKQWVILSDADHAALLETARFRFLHAIVSFIHWTGL